MPTVMTHAVVSLGLGKVFTARKMPLLFWEMAVILAVLPDIDVYAFRLGIPYEAFWGHRGFTHSLAFALLASLPVAALTCRHFGFGFWDLWGFLFVVTASHGILDALTSGGGYGVAFFSPLDDTRYFFPWRPVEVSDLGLAFFGARGIKTAWTEFVWIWLPTAAVVGAVILYRRRRTPATQQPSP